MNLKHLLNILSGRFQAASLLVPLFLLHQLCLCLFLCDVLHEHPEDEFGGDSVSFHSGFVNSLPDQEDCQLDRCRQNNLVLPESGLYGKNPGQSFVPADFLPMEFRTFIKRPAIVERTGRIPVLEKLYLLKHVLRC